MYEPEITLYGKKYKVLKLSVEHEENVLIRCIPKPDLMDACIDNITGKMKKALMDEIEKTNALVETTRQNKKGDTVRRMTLLVLEEVPDIDVTELKLDSRFVSYNSTTKPTAYSKSH